MEKSYKRQIASEVKKRIALKKQLESAFDMIQNLEISIKVLVWIKWFSEGTTYPRKKKSRFTD